MKVKLPDGSRVDLSTLTVNAATANQWAQFSHFFFGVFAVLVPWLVIGRYFNLIMFSTLTMYSAWKEFAYDEKDENPAERGSSLEDFCVQVGGGLVGLTLTLLLAHFGFPLVK